MEYKLENKNGKVTFLLKSGKDYVRNEMSISAAQHIIHTGKITESDREDYPICVDNKWYFKGEPLKAEPPVEETEKVPERPAKNKKGE